MEVFSMEIRGKSMGQSDVSVMRLIPVGDGTSSIDPELLLLSRMCPESNGTSRTGPRSS